MEITRNRFNSFTLQNDQLSINRLRMSIQSPSEGRNSKVSELSANPDKSADAVQVSLSSQSKQLSATPVDDTRRPKPKKDSAGPLEPNRPKQDETGYSERFDRNADGRIGIEDLSEVLSFVGSKVKNKDDKAALVDFDNNGEVNEKDVDALVKRFGAVKPPEINADVDGNGSIDLQDLAQVLTKFDQKSINEKGEYDPTDLNRDGITNQTDLDLLLERFGS